MTDSNLREVSVSDRTDPNATLDSFQKRFIEEKREDEGLEVKRGKLDAGRRGRGGPRSRRGWKGSGEATEGEQEAEARGDGEAGGQARSVEGSRGSAAEARQGEKAGRRAQLTDLMTEVSGPGGENRKNRQG